MIDTLMVTTRTQKSMELLGLQSVQTFDSSAFEQRLRLINTKLGKLSSAAYNVGSFDSFRAHSGGGTGVKPTRVAAMFAELAPHMASVASAIIERRDSEFTYQTITGLRGVGNFLGYQICVDLGYWDRNIYDESHHVVIGPGAEKGLGWLFSSTGGLSDLDCLRQLVVQQNEWFDKAGISATERKELFGYVPQPFTDESPELERGPLNLMAMEACLCEGNKYFRTRAGTGLGRTKVKYCARTGADDRYLADHAIAMSTLGANWNSIEQPQRPMAIDAADPFAVPLLDVEPGLAPLPPRRAHNTQRRARVRKPAENEATVVHVHEGSGRPLRNVKSTYSRIRSTTKRKKLDAAD